MPHAAAETFATIETRLAARLGAQRYRMWFEESATLTVDGAVLVVEVTRPFAAEWIERHYRRDLEEVAAEAAGCQEVRITVVEPPEGTPPAPPATGASAASGAAGAGAGAGLATSQADPSARRPRSTTPAWRRFEDFVVGPCNRVAFEATRRLADDSLGGIRCILLHGGCGVGKTHLLQALCAERRARFPLERIRYTTGEQFTNEYISAVRAAGVEEFRSRVRQLDMLAIDDVHFLSNKGATQAEFLHTLDAIGLAGKRVAIATDAHPRALASFSEALISRLLGGMVVQVEAPDRDTRQVLVERLALARGLELEPSAVRAVADRVLGSVREIEGALARIAAAALVADVPTAGLALVERALGAPATHRGQPPRIGAIVEAACTAIGVAPDELSSAGRHRRVVLARGVVVHLAREMTTLSFPEIARHLGRSAHSSVHAAAQRVAGMLERGEELPPSDCPCGARTVRELVETVRRSAERPARAAR